MDFILLGKRIREERLKLHLTQEKLSERVGISPNFMGQIERGDRKLSLETLVSIANSLSTTIDYLLSDSISISGDHLTRELCAAACQLDEPKRLLVLEMARRLKQI